MTKTLPFGGVEVPEIDFKLCGIHSIIHVVGPIVADGGEFLAAVPFRQSARVQRRIHEGICKCRCGVFEDDCKFENCRFSLSLRACVCLSVCVCVRFMSNPPPPRASTQIWREYDSDNSGYIEADELKNFLRDLLKEAKKINDVSEDKLIEYTDTMVSRTENTLPFIVA